MRSPGHLGINDPGIPTDARGKPEYVNLSPELESISQPAPESVIHNVLALARQVAKDANLNGHPGGNASGKPMLPIEQDSIEVESQAIGREGPFLPLYILGKMDNPRLPDIPVTDVCL
jgi:hypothetical protein